jgi:hypothetical protein
MALGVAAERIPWPAHDFCVCVCVRARACVRDLAICPVHVMVKLNSLASLMMWSVWWPCTWCALFQCCCAPSSVSLFRQMCQLHLCPLHSISTFGLPPQSAVLEQYTHILQRGYCLTVVSSGWRHCVPLQHLFTTLQGITFHKTRSSSVSLWQLQIWHFCSLLMHIMILWCFHCTYSYSDFWCAKNSCTDNDNNTSQHDFAVK